MRRVAFALSWIMAFVGAGCGAAGGGARAASTTAAVTEPAPVADAVLVLPAAPGPRTRQRASWLGLRVIVAASPRRARADVAPGIEQALAYYRDFEFARALEVLDGVDATLARTARDRDDVGAAVRSLVQRAANELALQREPAAVDALRAAAALLAPTDAAPTDVSPELGARLAAARAELGALAPARVAFVVSPRSARVRLDGNALDDPSATTSLPSGRHFVHVEREGHAPRVATVELAPGEEQRVELELGPPLADDARAQVSTLEPTSLAHLALAERRALGEALLAREVWRVEARGGVLVVSAIPLGDGAVRTARSPGRETGDAAVAEALAALVPSAPASASAAATTRSGPSEVPTGHSTSVLASPWLWLAVGVVVAGAATTAIVVATPPDRRGVLSIE